MKNLKYLNYFFVGIPALLISLGYITKQSSGNLIGCGLLFMILTGFFQLIIGVIFWMKFKDSLNIKIYFTLVLLFFSTWYFNENIFYIDGLTWPLISTPPILAIYLSIIIYKKANK